MAATVEIPDDAVVKVTEALCADALAVIATLAPERREEYLERMYERTRRALEDALGPAS